MRKLFFLCLIIALQVSLTMGGEKMMKKESISPDSSEKSEIKKSQTDEMKRTKVQSSLEAQKMEDSPEEDSEELTNEMMDDN